MICTKAGCPNSAMAGSIFCRDHQPYEGKRKRSAPLPIDDGEDMTAWEPQAAGTMRKIKAKPMRRGKPQRSVFDELQSHVKALEALADRLDPNRDGHRADQKTPEQRVAFEIDGALSRLLKAREVASGSSMR
jgi:hypothetical protein